MDNLVSKENLITFKNHLLNTVYTKAESDSRTNATKHYITKEDLVYCDDDGIFDGDYTRILIKIPNDREVINFFCYAYGDFGVYQYDLMTGRDLIKSWHIDPSTQLSSNFSLDALYLRSWEMQYVRTFAEGCYYIYASKVKIPVATDEDGKPLKEVYATKSALTSLEGRVVTSVNNIAPNASGNVTIPPEDNLPDDTINALFDKYEFKTAYSGLTLKYTKSSKSGYPGGYLRYFDVVDANNKIAVRVEFNQSVTGSTGQRYVETIQMSRSFIGIAQSNSCHFRVVYGGETIFEYIPAVRATKQTDGNYSSSFMSNYYSYNVTDMVDCVLKYDESVIEGLNGKQVSVEYVGAIDTPSETAKANYENLKLFKENSDDTYATKTELEDAGKVKTVNNIEPDENGNIAIPTAEPIDISTKADLSGAVFTGNVTAPKLILESGWELF